MRFLLPHSRFFLLLVIPAVTLSCTVYRYSAVRIERKIPFPYHHEKKSQPRKDAPDRDLLKKPRLENTLKVMKKRYFARIFSLSSHAKINNRGVDYALSGRFREAEVLFRELLREGENSAAMNNLGIIYEIFKNRKKAFSMYSRACIIEPHNSNFRFNLLSFLEADGRGLKGKNNRDSIHKIDYITERERYREEKK